MELGNPQSVKTWPIVTTVILVPSLALIGVVAVSILRPGQDNAALVTQILGFGVTITVATMAYLKSADTREVVNSRMDEFKRTIQLAANAAVLAAHAEGKQEGRDSANERTDVLASKTEAVVVQSAQTHELLKTHDQWERDRMKGQS